MVPIVTVLLPVYNARETLAAAIESILLQTFPDFELVIIDDGSSDGSSAIIESFEDLRVRHLTQSNRGLAASLNRGIEAARGHYLARLDADDAALPERLARQLAFFNLHDEVALLGTWADIQVAGRSTGRVHRHPQSSVALGLELLFDNPFVHSSIMARTAVLRELGGYEVRRDTPFPEDYELWSRIARKYQIANLPEVLTIYREVPTSITRKNAGALLENVAEVSAANIEATLEGRAPYHSCLALSRTYHGLVARQQLSSRSLLALWNDAAEVSLGARDGWAGERLASYSKINRRLLRRLVQRHLPAGGMRLLRKLVDLLRK